ncbi:MAG: phosphotransferase family protein [Alphaproteobacteria bacterium]|nr:phosphotransferase family protein [Alphaproteobacteria bacterium]
MAGLDFEPALAAALTRHVQGITSVGKLTRLSGGASQETFAFDAHTASGTLPLILRRAPGGSRDGGSGQGTALATEARAITAARACGVKAPEVVYVLTPQDGVGDGYVMERVEGETLARKILRDKEFDAVRPKLAYQCGQAMAQIHQADASQVPELRLVTGPQQLAEYYERYRAYDLPKPVFEMAFAWLKPRIKEPKRTVMVHGDFRHGNIMISPKTGLAAVLDWEIVHRGDPLEDLSWICINAWRFGVTGKVVGGFGDVPEMLAGYRDAGGDAYTVEDVRTWEVMGSLKWGIMCMGMYEVFRTGYDRSVERAAIGRRSSENEIDLVNLLIG